MDEHLQRETENLIMSWASHDPSMLGQYLVSSVQDPRINMQSILARHFLIAALFGGRFARLLEEELRFALAMNWVVEVYDKGAAGELTSLQNALERGADNAEGELIPPCVSAAYLALPATLEYPLVSESKRDGHASTLEHSKRSGSIVVPNYFEQLWDGAAGDPAAPVSVGKILPTFERIWRMLLEKESPAKLSVLEPACGSANDYRFLESFGMARLISYTGFDLCEQNVRNARAMFPAARFESGNVFSIPEPDRRYDYCVVHDLFEHLSIEGLDRALSEVCRVTRQGLCLGFFRMHEEGQHIVRPVQRYHINTLSMDLVRARIESLGFEVQVTHPGTLLKWRFGWEGRDNPNAYTLFAVRHEP
jgi:hypothetical protein